MYDCNVVKKCFNGFWSCNARIAHKPVNLLTIQKFNKLLTDNYMDYMILINACKCIPQFMLDVIK